MRLQRFAAATGKVAKLRNAIKSLESDLTAMTSDGIKFDVRDLSNERVYIIFKNGSGSAVTTKVLKPTTGGYAAADADLSVSLASGVGGAWVETAKYANQDGSIVCTGSTDVKAVVIYN